jgi:hypothetical protein
VSKTLRRIVLAPLVDKQIGFDDPISAAELAHRGYVAASLGGLPHIDASLRIYPASGRGGERAVTVG